MNRCEAWAIQKLYERALFSSLEEEEAELLWPSTRLH